MPTAPEWPPALPLQEHVTSAVALTMERAQALLLQEELSRREKRMVRNMDLGTTHLTIAIPQGTEGTLEVVLEIMHPTRVRAGNILIGEGEISFLVPSSYVHRAINGLHVHHARVLADILVHECVLALQERYDALIQTISEHDKASKSVIDPHQYDEQLVELHEAIRSGTLIEETEHQ